MLLPIILLASALAFVSATPSVTTTFSNAVKYKFDTDGNAIDLTSGKIDLLGGVYVWYGLPFACGEVFCGVTSYSSRDLETWEFNGFLFDPTTPEIQALCTPESSGNCGRPHIVYSAENDNYVLWVNAGTPGYVVFTSDTPTSNFVRSPSRALLGFQPSGPFSGADFSVQTINGTGYIAYSLIDFTLLGPQIWPPFTQSIYLQELLPSMLNTTGNVTHVISSAGDLVDFEAESPDIFKRGDWWYISASNTCGYCTGTLLVIYKSKSVEGPWERQIISADTCGGQSTGVLALPSPYGNTTSYLHMADLFSTAPQLGTRVASHGYQFQSLNFNPDGTVQDLNCSLSKSVSVTFIPGNITATNTPPTTTNSTTNSTINNVDSSSLLPSIIYTPNCTLPALTLYQTFSPSKSGLLTSLHLNLFAAYATANTTISLFRFANDTNFQTPFYLFSSLASLTVTPEEMSISPKAVVLPVSENVVQGERLGFSVQTQSLTDVCVLMREVEGSGELWANGVNQVSWRGKEGKTAPVQRLVGREVRWWVDIV